MSYAGSIDPSRAGSTAGTRQTAGADRPTGSAAGVGGRGGTLGDAPGATTRAQRARAATATASATASDLTRPRGRPFARQPDWGKVGLLGGGIALGVLIGAGIALLAAPYSGLETRTRLARRGRRMRHDIGDRWEDLRDELRLATKRAKRRVRRRIEDRLSERATTNGADCD